MFKSVSRLFAVLALSCAATLAQAQAPQTQPFKPLPQVQPTDSPGKIEVLEFFSYGCNHCKDFHPKITAWAAKLPADVVFKRVPVGFQRQSWDNLARLYYALEATGDLAKLDGDVFKALHEQRVNLSVDGPLKEWLAGKGVNTQKFMDVYASFTVVSKQKRAEQMVQAYGIQSVPAITVEGRYLVDGKDFDELLANADKLIAQIRAERKPAKPAKKK